MAYHTNERIFQYIIKHTLLALVYYKITCKLLVKWGA